MKRSAYILISALIFLPSCTKPVKIPTSGTVTINNILKMDPKTQAYYSNGFLFSTGSIVSSLSVPGPDVNIINDGTTGDLILATNNFQNSFYKAGTYASAAVAKTVFDTLSAPVVNQWAVWADSLKAGQVWIYKSGDEHYSKIRIVSTISEMRSGTAYSECTFDWVYQPDGSLTFPVK